MYLDIIINGQQSAYNLIVFLLPIHPAGEKQQKGQANLYTRAFSSSCRPNAFAMACAFCGKANTLRHHLWMQCFLWVCVYCTIRINTLHTNRTSQFRNRIQFVLQSGVLWARARGLFKLVWSVGRWFGFRSETDNVKRQCVYAVDFRS